MQSGVTCRECIFVMFTEEPVHQGQALFRVRRQVMLAHLIIAFQILCSVIIGPPDILQVEIAT